MAAQAEQHVLAVWQLLGCCRRLDVNIEDLARCRFWPGLEIRAFKLLAEYRPFGPAGTGNSNVTAKGR